jgi:hypothetical protein
MADRGTGPRVPGRWIRQQAKRVSSVRVPVWDDFVVKHEKKFFGPVGPNIARALLDGDMFETK